jgi:hypothetical protein
MTATATAPTEKVEKPLIPGPGVLAPKQLWTTYTWERGQGRSQAEAAEEALDRNHVSPKTDRERITKQLHRQELEWGLSQTPLEQVEEAERKAAEAEAIEAAHAAANPEPGTVEAKRKDAQQRVSELEPQISRLAPEALTDSAVRQKVLTLESELDKARKELQLIGRADSENARREQAAIEDAAKAAKGAALAKAHERQGPREKAVEKADKVAQAYVAALVEVRLVCDGQADDLAHGGEGIEQFARRRYSTDRATEALLHHLLAQNGDGLLDVGDLKQRHKSLSATEPSPV